MIPTDLLDRTLAQHGLTLHALDEHSPPAVIPALVNAVGAVLAQLAEEVAFREEETKDGIAALDKAFDELTAETKKREALELQVENLVEELKATDRVASDRLEEIDRLRAELAETLKRHTEAEQLAQGYARAIRMANGAFS